MVYRTEEIGGLSTTFTGDFDIAEAFGEGAVRDTFERSFDAWKNDIRYLTNLSVVCNMKCWEHYEKGDKKLSELYSDCYYKTRDYAYDDESPFTDEDRRYYFRLTD